MLFTTLPCSLAFFFFNDTATTEIYTLSLHDALPICAVLDRHPAQRDILAENRRARADSPDRKSTRLNSSHQIISYAVFCLKKKKQPEDIRLRPHLVEVLAYILRVCNDREVLDRRLTR